LRGPKLVWVPSKSGWLFVGTIGIGGLVQMIFILINHLVEPSIAKWCSSSQCHDKLSEVQMCYNIQVQNSRLLVNYWIYLMACKYLSKSFLVGWSLANQGISFVDHFIWVHMSWLNWIYICNVACYKMIEWKID